MNVKIVVDSCGDTHQSVLERYNIGMIPLNIHIGKMMRDGIDITPEDYYKIIEDVELLDTSAPNLSQWKECFETYLENDNYDKLVIVTIAQKLSNTYEQACIAARKYYPSKIEVLDSMSASAGEGLVAIKFRELLEKGYDYSIVYSFMQDFRLKIV